MAKFIDLINKVFSKLTVLHEDGHIGKEIAWLCKCECGNTIRTTGDRLRREVTKSCGCIHHEQLINRLKTHNLTNSKLYSTWCNIKGRCNNSNLKDYNYYGGRGIKVCEDWLNDFKSFYDWSISNGYNENLTIDRINVNGNYEPNNCRWVDMKTQARNTRRNHYITINNETKIIEQWAEENNINSKTLRSRLRNGFCSNNVLKISKGRGYSTHIK